MKKSLKPNYNNKRKFRLVDMNEPDYKDLLRRYALHVGEFAETTYTEPELSYNHITKEEAKLINELINEFKTSQQ